MMKLLVCGSRLKKNYSALVFKTLDEWYSNRRASMPQDALEDVFLIEGCCPNSADVYAEKWAHQHNIIIDHHPATDGNHLKRNIEMVKKCDLVFAFYDRFSYGTSYTISHAVLHNKPVRIFVIL